ncbi:MAG: hypothetical protein ACLUMQ_00205 [Streptococcus salivarius]
MLEVESNCKQYQTRCLNAAGATAGTKAGTWNAMADRRAHGLK